MMQRFFILFLVCIIVFSIAWLYSSAILQVWNSRYEPPPIEQSPRAYQNSRKVKWKKVICSKCHEDTTEWNQGLKERPAQRDRGMTNFQAECQCG